MRTFLNFLRSEGMRSDGQTNGCVCRPADSSGFNCCNCHPEKKREHCNERTTFTQIVSGHWQCWIFTFSKQQKLFNEAKTRKTTVKCFFCCFVSLRPEAKKIQCLEHTSKHSSLAWVLHLHMSSQVKSEFGSNHSWNWSDSVIHFGKLIWPAPQVKCQPQSQV